MRARTTILLSTAAGLVACAGGRGAPEAPPAAASPGAPPQEAPSGAAPASIHPRDSTSQETSTAARPPAPFTPAPPGRAAALSQASAEMETSQRELDVAGGDCQNACRALGSLDRAAGHLCGLARASDEVSRCEDAKARVHRARDKVRSTCGSCPEVSVDRDAPIPSR